MRNFFPFMTTSPEISGLRADLIYANYIIACLLPLFVIFLCIRMVSSTKKAGVLTVLLATVFVLFNRDVMLPVLNGFIDGITFGPAAMLGAFLGFLGALGLFKGLYDEEQSEEYVHKRKYWYATVAIMYAGIVLACHAVGK